MTLAERFLVQADECDRMSKIGHDQTNKILWRGMADRWRQCAELERKNARATKQRSRRARPGRAKILNRSSLSVAGRTRMGANLRINNMTASAKMAKRPDAPA